MVEVGKTYRFPNNHRSTWEILAVGKRNAFARYVVRTEGGETREVELSIPLENFAGMVEHREPRKVLMYAPVYENFDGKAYPGGGYWSSKEKLLEDHSNRSGFIGTATVSWTEDEDG